jgi:peptidoglycan/xylan/chitin deacetylase (PgdA/CDA1 family)
MITKYLTVFFLTLSFIFSDTALAKNKHLPEQREYTNIDLGYSQYGTPSLMGNNQYALTFDDGPHTKLTPKLLDSLKKYNAKATFFIVADRVNTATQPIIKRILDEGHIIASHDLVHDNNNQINEARFKEKFKKSFKILSESAKKAGHTLDKFYFRFPYAAYGERADYHHLNTIRNLSLELFGKNCIHFVFWDIDSSDWVPTLTPDNILSNIKAYQEGGDYFTFEIDRSNGGRRIVTKKIIIEKPTKGGVILFHDIQERTINSIESILEYFKMNEIEVVKLDKIKEFDGNDFQGCHLTL